MTGSTNSTTTTTTLANGATVISTVESTRFDNGVTDVSIIPYMRSQGLQFAASNLRPNRRVYFFFDDVNVDEYILQANEVQLTEDNDVTLFNSGFSNADSLVLTSNTSQTASLIQVTRFFDFDNATPSLQDDAKPRKRKRILRWVNNSIRFANNQGFTGDTTGVTGTVGAVTVNSVDTLRNFFQNSTANTIQLPAYTSSLPNNYWGRTGANTIALVPKQNRRRRSVIAYIGTADGTRGFDNVTQTLFLMNTAASLGLSNSTIGLPSQWAGGFNPAPPSGIPATAGPFRTDAEGKISGTFFVPAGTFRTGDRIFRIIDDLNNDPADCTTRADYRFTASGLQQTKQDTVINTVETTVVPPPPSEPERPRPDRGRDPIAQTFFVNESEHPNGVFISAVGLYFYNKDEILPVVVQIRPTVNGFPHSSKILPYAESTLDSELITTSDNASVETKIKFDVPIYLEPGEYALVVKSDSLQYEVFVSEIGSKIIGTNRIVSAQPYLGSFFKSQNASTWDAVQLEDLTFNLYKCVFSTSGNLTFVNDTPTTNAPADIVYTHIDDLVLPNTRISYVHSLDNGGSFTTYIPDTNFRNPSGRVTFNSGTVGQYRLTASLTTNDTDISPVIYNKTGLLTANENIIDSGDIEADDISILNPGFYPGNANGVLTVTISDYRGNTASALANVNSTGNIANIVITSAGSGFINTATATIAQTAGTMAATFKVASELDPSGGPIQAKHFTRSVTLAGGFDGGDLRLFLTAYKPIGTDIKVYYKIKAADDPEPFADKSYVLMNQKTRSTSYSSVNNFNDAIEYEFEPYDSINAISYSTSSTTYTTFNQFAFKVALTTDDTSKVPIIYDMRAVALPAMST
jgi:hypothetical protein